eukprot:2345580-Rhodomonas_salina.1
MFVYIDNFRNLDLFHQGEYSVRPSSLNFFSRLHSIYLSSFFAVPLTTLSLSLSLSSPFFPLAGRLELGCTGRSRSAARGLSPSTRSAHASLLSPPRLLTLAASTTWFPPSPPSPARRCATLTLRALPGLFLPQQLLLHPLPRRDARHPRRYAAAAPLARRRAQDSHARPLAARRALRARPPRYDLRSAYALATRYPVLLYRV